MNTKSVYSALTIYIFKSKKITAKWLLKIFTMKNNGKKLNFQ